MKSSRQLAVIVHDVCPRFGEEVRQIADALDFMPAGCVSAAVVPDWHGKGDKWEPGFVKAVKGTFGELLLHGYVHLNTDRRLKNVFFREWELAGAGPEAIRNILREGKSRMGEVLQTTPTGFVPPAWTGGSRLTPEFMAEAGIYYCLDYFSLRRYNQSAGMPAETGLSTWSWDWGRFPGAGYAGHLAGNLLSLRGRDVAQVVLHPADVKRGYMRIAVQKIRQLLDKGYLPVLPHQLAHG